MDRLVSSLFLFSFLGLCLGQYEAPRAQQAFRPAEHPPASILLHKQALGQDGSFNYAFAADNGLQQGEIINPDGSRRGSYSYVDPNGKTVSLSYTAGKDGFRVLDGEHVPKPPEPQQQLQQQRQQQPQPQPQYHHQPPPNYYQQLPQPRLAPQYLQRHRQEQPYYPVPHGPAPVPYEAYRNAPDAPVYRGEPVPYREPYGNDRRGSIPQPPPPPPPHAFPQYRVGPVQYEAPVRAPQPRPVPHYQPRQYSVQEGNYEKPSPYVGQQYQGPEQRQKPHSFGDGFSFEFAG